MTTTAAREGIDRLLTHVGERLAQRRAADDRRLLAAASRALREAGWTADRRTPAAWRNSRNPRRGDWYLFAWTPGAADGVVELEIWHPVAGVQELTCVPVTSAQQAVDVVAALTGVGVGLTTGGRRAAAVSAAFTGASEALASADETIAALDRQAEIREQLIVDLEALVSTDQLTGVHSRRWAVDAIVEAGDVIIVDLDGFKLVNDTYGHAIGDRVLVEVAGRLNDLAPRLVARIGGDEFVVVIPAGAPLHADALAEAAALAIGGTTVDVDGVEIDVCASIGVAPVLDGDAPEDVLHRADIAMYHHKRGTADHDGPVHWLPGMTAPTAPAPLQRTHRDAPEAAA